MDRELLNKAIASMELMDIYLNESSIKRDKEFDHGYPTQELLQQNKLLVTADILGTEGHKQGNVLRALVTAGARFVAKDHSGEPPSEAGAQKVLAELEASFCAVYRYDIELTDDELGEFLRFNAVHNVWPFWREHALRMAAEAKLHRPSIPLMKPKGVSE